MSDSITCIVCKIPHPKKSYTNKQGTQIIYMCNSCYTNWYDDDTEKYLNGSKYPDHPSIQCTKCNKHYPANKTFFSRQFIAGRAQKLCRVCAKEKYFNKSGNKKPQAASSIMAGIKKTKDRVETINESYALSVFDPKEKVKNLDETLRNICSIQGLDYKQHLQYAIRSGIISVLETLRKG